jgi:hypothetical protein
MGEFDVLYFDIYIFYFVEMKQIAVSTRAGLRELFFAFACFLMVRYLQY